MEERTSLRRMAQIAFIAVSAFWLVLKGVSAEQADSPIGSASDGRHPASEGHQPAVPKGVPHRPVPWKEPEKILSPPPPLMGKPMGTVNTLNVPPLGYEMDGYVKVFTLIAQPVLHTLTEGKPKSYLMIQEMNRFMGGMHHMLQEPKTMKGWGYNGHRPLAYLTPSPAQPMGGKLPTRAEATVNVTICIECKKLSSAFSPCLVADS